MDREEILKAFKNKDFNKIECYFNQRDKINYQNIDFEVNKFIYSSIDIFKFISSIKNGKIFLLNYNCFLYNLKSRSPDRYEILDFILEKNIFFNDLNFNLLNESIKEDFLYFKKLYEYSNIDITEKAYLIFKNAIFSENLEAVKYLVSLNIFDLSFQKQTIFLDAITYENEISDYIINLQDIDPSYDNNIALMKTIVFDKKENFFKLMKHKKVLDKLSINFEKEFFEKFPTRNLEEFNFYLDIVKKQIKVINF